MIRYSTIDKKNQREIVLLKSSPCIWGKCSFCDYINDNDKDITKDISLNKSVLKKVTGKYGVLEIINSGSCFEIPKPTLEDIKSLISYKKINKLFFESHWLYRHRLHEMKDFFEIPIIFKCGIETFDSNFRNKVLNKNAIFSNPLEVSRYFKSICLLVGIQGQTKDMIKQDIEYLLKYFEYGCINIFVENSTNIKRDENLIEWFHGYFHFLEKEKNIEILWNNTDFGVGSTK
ncbi:MAG: radical SAM protein [Clostridium sp.]|uniref:radical SAM protein n=1 Tax=Clostridium sp. TaxID=1506 RepID=UPI0025C51349|nr:radical SAM protein [Clostridium sp.]MCH3963091.1 radical SAM protein [Clostridium sp.]MCI1716446.1 radical SAM protein [Clostridium sp.]MCI1800786.1 radical SAM protein [Clostridium sp.]MCI1814559.1 radical SAM protein [Clostridium sp.]MCI1871469.1 radical SAM protein [Clostridium sp.]